MTFGAVLMMVVTMGIVTFMVTYFFIKVLRSPGPKEADSEDNRET